VLVLFRFHLLGGADNDTDISETLDGVTDLLDPSALTLAL
jgi:hypothetical protein